MLRRTGLDAQRVEDVVLGCVTQVGEQGWNIARGAVLRRDLRYGAATLCIGYGMGITTIIDRKVG